MLKQKSRYSGSLWITHHTDRKIAGAESIVSLCTKKCKYAQFCYSEKMFRIMKGVRKKAEENNKMLSDPDSGFITPKFTSCIVRWFSLGSCNGDLITLQRVKQSVDDNPNAIHGIWVEPWYWDIAVRALKQTDGIKLVWSHKVIDEYHVPEPWYNSFNVASSKEKAMGMIESVRKTQDIHQPAPVYCIGKCQECGWKCYKKSGQVVIEVKRT